MTLSDPPLSWCRHPAPGAWPPARPRGQRSENTTCGVPLTSRSVFCTPYLTCGFDKSLLGAQALSPVKWIQERLAWGRC